MPSKKHWQETEDAIREGEHRNVPDVADDGRRPFKYKRTLHHRSRRMNWFRFGCLFVGTMFAFLAVSLGFAELFNNPDTPAIDVNPSSVQRTIEYT